MNRVEYCVSAMLLAAMCGCSRGPAIAYTDHSRDPEAFAATVKQLVFVAVADARTSPEPADDLASIVGVFADRMDDGSLPLGEYVGVYQELFSLARDLHDACETIDGRPADLAPRLDHLLEVARRLPGDVPVVNPPRR